MLMSAAFRFALGVWVSVWGSGFRVWGLGCIGFRVSWLLEVVGWVSLVAVRV